MKTAELIRKLEKIEAENPDSEVGFYLEGMGTSPGGFDITFVNKIVRSHESYGPVWKLQFFTDRALPR